MHRRLAPCITALLVVASVVGLEARTRAQTSAPGYVSVIFGRTQWVTTGTVGGVPCTPLTGAIPLDVTHDALAARSIPATGVVITDRTPDSGLRCFNGYVLHPGWDLLQAWHAEGWRFVSGGTHADVTSLDYEGVVTETCASLPVFEAHGMDATGMFAYGNNTWTTASQTDPVSRCFAYGRRYTAWQANTRSTLTAPWMQRTHSVNGGNCNDSSQPCYTFSAPYRYHSPVTLAAHMSAAPDTWFAVQFYRLVGGKGGSGIWTWDCTSPDWRRHWTSRGELYCYEDFLSVMDALEAAVATGTVQAVDPGTVAAAWGRLLAPPAPGVPRTTIASLACPEGWSVTCTVTVRDTSDGIPAPPQGTVAFTAADGSFDPNTCTLSGGRPATSCSVTVTAPVGATSLRQITATYEGSAEHFGETATAWHNPTGDVAGPSVRITSPSSGSVPRFTTIQIAADASDPSGVVDVRFFVGGKLRCADAVAPYTCSWRTPAAGKTVTLRATARDPLGNAASHSISVRTV